MYRCLEPLPWCATTAGEGRKDVLSGDLRQSQARGDGIGKSEREVAREFGIHRNTVRKMLKFALPPGCQRKTKPASPKLDGFIAVIDAILEADRAVHKKQRHTAQRILQRLRSEHGFNGSYTIVREYVAKRKLLRIK